MKNISKEVASLFSLMFNELFFYSAWTITGWIVIILAALMIFLSFASSANVLKYGKINMSRSLKSKRKMRNNGYILLGIGILFLIIGFRDKFRGSVPNAQIEGVGHYKKCTPFREGFGTCRTFDRNTIWVVRKESDGSEVARIEFPDSLNVISVGIFREGHAEVVGESSRRKYTVGYLTTSGDFVSKE